MKQEHKEIEQTLRAMTDFVLQFDKETQELLMRVFELYAKPALTEEEAEELNTLLFKLRRAEAGDDPIKKAILLAEEVAGQAAFKRAEEAGLSVYGVMVATVTAESKAGGDTPSEAQEYVLTIFPQHSRDVLEAIDEVKRAGLWPWKGLN